MFVLDLLAILGSWICMNLLFAFALRMIELQTAWTDWTAIGKITNHRGIQLVFSGSEEVKPGQFRSFQTGWTNGWMSSSFFISLHHLFKTKFTLGTHHHTSTCFWLKHSKFTHWKVLHWEPREEQSHHFDWNVHVVPWTHVASPFDTLQFSPRMDASSKPCHLRHPT